MATRDHSKLCLIALLAIAMPAAFLLGTSVLGQTDDTAVAEGTAQLIAVNGQGRVAARPDTATARIGVTTEADSAAAALDQNYLRSTA
jgi:uncharacterized protein YggE